MKISYLFSICYCVYFAAFGQSQNQWGEMSIYELGDSIVSYETNFKNLFVNWTRENVTNAGEFEWISYEFVEALDDEQTYQFYRNFFSGDEAVGISMRGSTKVNAMGRVKELYILPGYGFSGQYLDTARFPQKLREVITPDFYQAMENQINKEVNIDDIELDQYQYLKHKTDTAYYYGDSSGKRKVRSYASQQASFDYSTPNEFSQDYIDIMINHTKSVFDLSSDAVKEFILEDILVNRIRVQRQFNKLVSIGDKVYVIHFTYNGKDYSNYVICDADSKKVVYDNVFLGVKIPKED